MKPWQQSLLVGLVILVIGAIGVFLGNDIKESRAARDANPFTKIGQITTSNGLAVEFYSLRHTRADCVVAVQMVPMEPGRAAIQMECK